MQLSPDENIYWQYGFVKLNETIAITWGIMMLLAIASFLVTRKLKITLNPSKWQSILEIIVLGIKQQIEDVGLRNSTKYLGFIGTIFLFIAVSNSFIIIPGYDPPTASISTTVALAICVFSAVPAYGIVEKGLGGYLKSYFEPSFIMMPFNVISELTRTLALAVRLFGNIMSGVLIVSILVSLTPFIFPIIMTALGLLTGMVQAYIFAILATVYIAAATRTEKEI